MRVLVVDDELFICELLDEYLTLQGYQVNTASNGADAISRFEEHRPHIVLLDIRMPGMSGIELLGKIKQIDGSIKVIMLSAFGDDGIVRDALQMGADHYIQKPMKLQELMEILHGWEALCPQGGAGVSA
jgi:YesN/AraC family two-component response regulator